MDESFGNDIAKERLISWMWAGFSNAIGAAWDLEDAVIEPVKVTCSLGQTGILLMLEFGAQSRQPVEKLHEAPDPVSDLRWLDCLFIGLPAPFEPVVHGRNREISK
jgi:hypothetical protein